MIITDWQGPMPSLAWLMSGDPAAAVAAQAGAEMAQTMASRPQGASVAPGANLELEVQRLQESDRQQALNFLNRRPLHNVALIGCIHDHGIESAHHRGIIYGCFASGQLIGVALLGHHVVLSGSQAAILAFADIARLFHESEMRLVFGDEAAVMLFCHLLTPPFSCLRAGRAQSYLLFVLTKVLSAREPIAGLRLARSEDLEEVMQSHARDCAEQTGVDPLKQDATGFRHRVRARIERARIWLIRDEQGIAFKATVVAETEDAAYLEGIWVRPDLRGTGLGRAAVKEVCRSLLGRHPAICLLTQTDHPRLISFYQGIGFEPIATYSAIRLQLA